MKCSEYVKSKGVKSLTFMSEYSGVPVTTLRDWYKTRLFVFNAVLSKIPKNRDDSYEFKSDVEMLEFLLTGGHVGNTVKGGYVYIADDTIRMADEFISIGSCYGKFYVMPEEEIIIQRKSNI